MSAGRRLAVAQRLALFLTQATGASLASSTKLALRLVRWVRLVWRRLTLTLKFAIAASFVVAIGMMVIGNWVSGRIQEGVVNTAAAAEAVYVEKYITPHLQELAHAAAISEENKLALDRLLTPTAVGKPILAFRIWKGGNVLVYSDRKKYLGTAFPETSALARAWKGSIVGEFDHLTEEHSAGHPMLGAPVLEIYAPVYEHGTNRIIALAETYELAPTLRQELTRAQMQSWFTVGAVSLAIIGCLFGIVHNGSRTIQLQRISLEQRIAELSRVLAENTDLRQRVDYANQRMAEANERLLRRIGSDLHDGPVQLLGLALLKLDDLCDEIEEMDKGMLANTDSPEVMRMALTETLQEIRQLSAGLAPPDVESLSIGDTLRTVARKHEQLTGTSVACDVSGIDIAVPFPIKTCLYRFAQEGLNNAYRHAGGVGQTLLARCDGDTIEIRVKDQGPGMVVEQMGKGAADQGSQGLSGLRFRVESLGGTFQVQSRLGQGTSLLVRFPLSQPEPVA